jgi:hypothetical protein
VTVKERRGRAKHGGLRARSAALFVGATLLVGLSETRCARLLDIAPLGVDADGAPSPGDASVDASAPLDASRDAVAPGDANHDRGPLPYMLGYVVGGNADAAATVASWLGRPLDVVGNSIDTNAYIFVPPGTDGGRPPLLEANFPMLSIFAEKIQLDDMGMAADGGYDVYYASMARSLAASADPLLAVRIGAQCNSTRYPWSNGHGLNATYANYVAAFQRIAMIIRMYNPGVLVEWCVTWGGADPTPYWPGTFDSEKNPGGADVVSMVLYEADVQSDAWANAQEGGTVNLDWMADYAQRNGLKMALAEYAAGTPNSNGIGSGTQLDDGAWTTAAIGWMNAQPAGVFLWESWSGYPEADDLVTPGANPQEQAAWKAAWSGTSFGGTWWDGAAPPSQLP